MQDHLLSNQITALETLYKNAAYPVCLLDCTMNIVWRNPSAAEKMVALSVSDGVLTLLSKPLIDSTLSRLSEGLEAAVMGNQQPVIRFYPVMEEAQLKGIIAVFAESIQTEGGLLPGENTDHFISAITRQSRDPLTMIFSSLGMLSRGMPDKTSDSYSYVREITKNSYKLLRSNAIVSEYIRYFYGNAELSITNEDICEVLERICNQIDEVVPLNIGITLNLPKESCIVAVDADKLLMVMANLIDNSCTFKKEGDSHISISLRCTESNIIITVEDDGRGIPEHVLPSVLTPFFSYTCSQIPYAGYGLGLTVCKMIIHHMGGTLAISSEEGNGTTVALTIPNRREQSTELTVKSQFTLSRVDRFSTVNVIMSNSCNCPEI